MNRILPMLLILVAIVSGCNGPDSQRAAQTPKATSPSTPEEKAHDLILRYNQLLIEGYKTNNMTKLQEVATLELAQKAYYHMAAIAEGNSRLVSDLKKIDFKKTDCSQPGKCQVQTSERWDFGYVDARTGQKMSEVTNYLYEVRYDLENRGGSWMLTDINATGEERKELPSWKDMFKKK